jgi:hypothetical protein
MYSNQFDNLQTNDSFFLHFYSIDENATSFMHTQVLTQHEKEVDDVLLHAESLPHTHTRPAVN